MFLTAHLCLSVVDSRTQKTMRLKEIGLCVQKLITTLNQIVNIIERRGGGQEQPFNEHTRMVGSKSKNEYQKTCS